MCTPQWTRISFNLSDSLYTNLLDSYLHHFLPFTGSIPEPFTSSQLQGSPHHYLGNTPPGSLRSSFHGLSLQDYCLFTLSLPHGFRDTHMHSNTCTCLHACMHTHTNTHTHTHTRTHTSGPSSSSPGSWYSDSHRESFSSSRGCMGLDSSGLGGAIQEDIEASQSEIFIQVSVKVESPNNGHSRTSHFVFVERSSSFQK